MLVFLELNDFDFVDDQDDIANTFERRAAGRLDQGTLFEWVREKAHARTVVE
jgi:prophage maintenance system killer protein